MTLIENKLIKDELINLLENLDISEETAMNFSQNSQLII